MIRQPVAAGKYYSSSMSALKAEVKRCIWEEPAPPVAGPCLQCDPAERRHLRGLIVSLRGCCHVLKGYPGASFRGPLCDSPQLPTAARPALPHHAMQVPHGSMQDSGFAAAAAFRLLLDELASGGTQGHPYLPYPLRCVMLGTNHFTNAPLACLSAAAAWRTPLGDVAVDAPLNAALAAQGLPFDDTPHK